VVGGIDVHMFASKCPKGHPVDDRCIVDFEKVDLLETWKEKSSLYKGGTWLFKRWAGYCYYLCPVCGEEYDSECEIVESELIYEEDTSREP